MRSANDDVSAVFGDGLSLPLALQGIKLKIRIPICRDKNILLDRCAASHVQVQGTFRPLIVTSRLLFPVVTCVGLAT